MCYNKCMPIRTVQFANNEFYHLIKRGVEERKIFLDDEDRTRFVNSLLVFNTSGSVPWSVRSFWQRRDPASSLIGTYEPEDPFVEIHAFALMDNHFHLLVKQISENGVSNFMNKLGGYSYYFNKKYKRVGPLFQGRFKAVLVRTDAQLRNAFVYVNTNPIGLLRGDWKEKGVEDFVKTKEFLETYRWSSYPDYLGKEGVSLAKKDFFLKVFGSNNDCREEVESWLKHKVDLSKYKDIALE